MAEKPKDPKDVTDVAAKPGAGSGGGFMSWLPLVLTFVLMPVLAYAMTMFVLVPKMQKALGGGAAVEARESAGEHGSASAGSTSGSHGAKPSGKEGAGPKARVKVPLSKIVVNVNGSLGTRLLLVSLTLAGSGPDFKQRIEDEADQLRDMASSVLATKTITDLEKPEARNLIRSELLTHFGTVLGPGTVQDIYIPEFAIQ